MNIRILCNKGIELDNMTILLGDNIKNVLNNIELEDNINDCYYFFDSNLSITVEDNKICFIQINSDDCLDFNVYLDDINVFSVKRNDFLKYLADINREELVNEVGILTASKIGISVDEGLSQSDIDEMIEDAEKEGIIDEMMDSIICDIKRMEHISSISVFNGTNP